MLLTCTSPLIAIALQKGTSIVYPILWRRQIQLCLNTVRRVDCHLSQESSPTSSPWLATLGRDNVKPNNRSKTQEQPTQPASTQTCEKSVSTFYCPSLSQTSTVGKVSSVKLFHKLSKNTASRKPTKTSSLQARNYQTTSAVSKTLPGFPTPNKTAKAQARSKVPLPSSTSG